MPLEGGAVNLPCLFCALHGSLFTFLVWIFCFVFSFWFFETVLLCSSGWLRTRYVAEDGLELLAVLLLLPSKCWHYMHVPPCAAWYGFLISGSETLVILHWLVLKFLIFLKLTGRIANICVLFLRNASEDIEAQFM